MNFASLFSLITESDLLIKSHYLLLRETLVDRLITLNDHFLSLILTDHSLLRTHIDIHYPWVSWHAGQLTLKH